MVGTPTNTSHTLAAVTVHKKRVRPPGGGPLIEMDELQATIPALSLASGVVPDTADKLTVGSTTYAITAVHSSGAAAGVATAYVVDLTQVTA